MTYIGGFNLVSVVLHGPVSVSESVSHTASTESAEAEDLNGWVK